MRTRHKFMLPPRSLAKYRLWPSGDQTGLQSRAASCVTALRNDSGQPQVFRGTIEFQDSDGFIVDTGSTDDMLVPAKSEQVFTGYALINAEGAGKLARTVAKIGKGG